MAEQTAKITKEKGLEIKLKLRELIYNLFNSKTIFELDQNRLFAKKYIYETNILKTKYDDEIKQFKTILKTKKYKDATRCIHEEIKKAVEELALNNKQTAEYVKHNNNSEQYSIYIANENNDIVNHYYNISDFCVFESCLYTTPEPLSITVYDSIYSFYMQRGRNIINEICSPGLFKTITNKYKTDNFNDSADYILNNSKIEYFLSDIDYNAIFATKELKRIHLYNSQFQIEIVSTALCQVLLLLDAFINDCINNNNSFANIKDNVITRKYRLKYNNETDAYYINNKSFNLTDTEKYIFNDVLKPINKRENNNTTKDNNYRKQVSEINKKFKNMFPEPPTNKKIIKTQDKLYILNTDFIDFL